MEREKKKKRGGGGRGEGARVEGGLANCFNTTEPEVSLTTPFGQPDLDTIITQPNGTTKLNKPK